MPVSFLSPAQRDSYGQYLGDPSTQELARYFHLDDSDHTQIVEKRGDANRLGFALQLTTVRFVGTFLDDPTAVPPAVLATMSRQLGIDTTTDLTGYRDGKAKRRATLIQLNRGEGRHALARAVFHGKRGELRQRYREGQENQLDALGVVVNMIVLWNTIYMQAALDLHRADGHSVRPEDEARLSPLGHEHINLLGRYSFAVPESVARGELRPLRNPADGGR